MLIDIARGMRDGVRKGLRSLAFERAITRLLKDPARLADDPDRTLEELVYGWGNEGWSGNPTFLRSCAAGALRAKGPMLECGSGLSTVIVGIVAQHTGNTLWTLEHIPEWGGRLQGYLSRFALANVRLCVAPLSSYGDFDWYTPPMDAMPTQFDFVICDGPPAKTRGGRYGLGQIMKDRLAQGCTILLDDAERSSEQSIMQRWAQELPCTYLQLGDATPYFVATVGRPTEAGRSMPSLR